jgi:hypothetical protein
LYVEELGNLYSLPHVVTVVTSSRMRCVVGAAYTREIGAYEMLQSGLC